MNKPLPEPSPVDRLERQLLALAAVFLFLYAAALTLAPAARLRSWQADLEWGHWLGYVTWAVGVGVAHRIFVRRLPRRDPYLLPLTGALTGWGLLMIWRLTPIFGGRQTIWFALGIAILVVVIRARNLQFLRNYKYVLLSGGLLLTGLTLVLGTNPSGFGPRLWLGCCGFYFQPSEPLKLLLVIYLAAYLADRQFFIPNLLPLLIPTLIMTGLTMALLLIQRDLGTATIFLFLYTSVLFVATGRRRILLISVALLLLAGVAGYSLFDVVRLRIEAWVNPWLDPSGRSYQIVQSLLAIAAGGLLGRGPGLGNPTVVPVNHSDFIFSAIAEETGLAGVIGLVALFAAVSARGWRIALKAPDSFQRYLGVGLTAFLVGQMILITGGNLRLLPLTGVTLPFVSYGGSSLVTSWLAFLLILMISNQANPDLAPFPSYRPVRHLSGALFLGLIAVAIASGWWAIYRGPGLLTRTDNPRRGIADRFVLRGAILDREQAPINLTAGEPGNYTRTYQVPELSPVLGYLHPVYGQAGLEASLDEYLRGLAGQPQPDLLWNNLLYGQPPPGLDVRLSLDLTIQYQADQAMEDANGALVLINAQSGEILAMASHPGFDPNSLAETWPALIQDPDAPLVNRAVQGRYHPGPALGPFILAAALAGGPLPTLPSGLSTVQTPAGFACSDSPEAETWGAMIRAGCPEPIAFLGSQVGSAGLQALFDDLGFYSQPLFRLDTGPAEAEAQAANPGSLAFGGETMRVSPLQMALAAAGISSNGTVPAPRLVMAVRRPGSEWTLLPPTDAARQAGITGQRAAELLTTPELRIWQITATTPIGSDAGLTWYLAGTTEGWQGTPLALALVLEETNAARALEIGQMVLRAATAP